MHFQLAVKKLDDTAYVNTRTYTHTHIHKHTCNTRILRCCVWFVQLSRVEMRADHDVLQHIIGKNNSNLNRVAKEHSVKVVVDRDSRTVRVLGNSQEQVERARQALELIGDSMELSKDEVPLVIGKGGKQIHAIEKESGVHAIVVRAKRGTARIIGTPSAVAHARALIHAVVDSVAYTKHMVREAAALKRELEDLPPPQQDNKS